MKKTMMLLLSVILIITVSACGADKLNVTPAEIFEHITESVELPIMADIDESRLPDYNVNIEDAESFVAKEAAISAIFVQIIIIEAKDGKANNVHNAMLEHQSSLKNQAFYPQGIEAAAASIVNAKGNLVYLICHDKSQEIEEILLKFIA